MLSKNEINQIVENIKIKRITIPICNECYECNHKINNILSNYSIELDFPQEVYNILQGYKNKAEQNCKIKEQFLEDKYKLDRKKCMKFIHKSEKARDKYQKSLYSRRREEKIINEYKKIRHKLDDIIFNYC